MPLPRPNAGKFVPIVSAGIDFRRPEGAPAPTVLQGEGGPALLDDLPVGDSCKDVSVIIDPALTANIPLTMWLPGGVPKIRCVMLGPADRRDLARLHHCAYLPIPSNPHPTTAQILAAFKDAAVKSGHPEIEGLYMLGNGYSHTYGERVAQLIGAPERVLAIFGGGIHAIWPKSPAVAHIPWLSFNGDKDNASIPSQYIVSNSNGPWWAKNVADGRSRGSSYAHAMRWGYFHEEGDSRNVMFPFYHEVLAKRSMGTAPFMNGSVRDLKEEEGWLVSTEDWNSFVPTIGSFKDWKGDKSKASWVPNAFMAHVVRAYTSMLSPVFIVNPECRSDQCVPRSAGVGSRLSVDVLVTGEQPAKVEIYDGDKPLFALTTAPYSFPVTGLTPGVHAFIAIATYSNGNRALSRPRSVIVNKPGSSCVKQPAVDAGSP